MYICVYIHRGLGRWDNVVLIFEELWPLIPLKQSQKSICAHSILKTRIELIPPLISTHWGHQRSPLFSDCCGWLLSKQMQNWFHAFSVAARLDDKLTVAVDHTWRDDTGIRSAVTPKTVGSTASASAHTCTQIHPHTCDHVRSSRSSSARDVFARGWREPSLLLPPISCLARGIHSNWKSKSKAWGLRRIWERRRGGPCIPHTRAHFNASVRQSGYQSVVVAAQTVFFFFPRFLFLREWA